MSSDESWLHHNRQIDDAPSLYASCYYGEDHELRPAFVKRYRDALEEAIFRLTEESHLVQAFRGHPNVIQLLGVGKIELFGVDEATDGDWCLVYELGEYSLSGQPRSAELAAGVDRDIGAALEAIHARDLVHGDVHPGNIIRVGEVWKIADFDNCVSIGKPTRGQPADPKYVAPGRDQGCPADPAHDLFGLDAVVAELRGGDSVVDS